MASKFMSLIYWTSVVTTDALLAVRYPFSKSTLMMCIWHHTYSKTYQSLHLHVPVVISVSSLSCVSFLFLPSDVSFSFLKTTSTHMWQPDDTACIDRHQQHVYIPWGKARAVAWPPQALGAAVGCGSPGPGPRSSPAAAQPCLSLAFALWVQKKKALSSFFTLCTSILIVNELQKHHIKTVKKVIKPCKFWKATDTVYAILLEY